MLKTELFTTLPQSIFSDCNYADEVRNIAALSEAHGYMGTLIYSDNRLVDPWTLAGFLLAETRTLQPMIALQPVYMHPYTVAKKIATLGLLYGRQVSLNLVAGGFKNDLLALGDRTDHDRRYQRLVEYTEIIKQLLNFGPPVTYEGDFYNVRNLRLQPELPRDLHPLYYLSGSSDAAKQAAVRLDARLIEYPEPASGMNGSTVSGISTGIRIGILARDTHDEAWSEAYSRFPKTREGALTHQLAQKISDSNWHSKLSEQGNMITDDEPVYWLGPFQHYQTFCPYLVGDHKQVTEEISHYLEAGCRTCILDIPVSGKELKHTQQVFRQAEKEIVSCT